MSDDLRPSPELVDSGYTEDELNAIFDSLTQGVTFISPFEAMRTAMRIGLAAGDMIALTERGTVMLRKPRAKIDARVAAIREAIAGGATFGQALEITSDRLL